MRTSLSLNCLLNRGRHEGKVRQRLPTTTSKIKSSRKISFYALLCWWLFWNSPWGKNVKRQKNCHQETYGKAVKRHERLMTKSPHLLNYYRVKPFFIVFDSRKKKVFLRWRSHGNFSRQLPLSNWQSSSFKIFPARKEKLPNKNKKREKW